MLSIFQFLGDNWQGIIGLAAMAGHMFPKKTIARRAADAIIAHPESVQKIVNAVKAK